MWQRRFGIPAPPAWPVAVVFTLSLGIAAARAEYPAQLTADWGLAALAVAAAVSAANAGLGTATAVGVVAWLFDNGFVVHRFGVLHWDTASDGPALALLVACAVGSALLGLRRRRGPARSRPPTGLPRQPQTSPSSSPETSRA